MRRSDGTGVGQQWRAADDRLLMPWEVAALFRVDPKTVTRWANSGRLPAEAQVRTLGGHRRYREAVIRALLAAGSVERTAEPGPWKGP